MSDYLNRIPDDEIDFGPELPLPTDKEEAEIDQEKCCGDAEYCVQASCVICPECGCEDTIRTTLPDEKNISEFECMECECFFVASNP